MKTGGPSDLARAGAGASATGLFTLTRGEEGGADLTGPELFDAFGDWSALRSCWRADRLLTARLTSFFSRANRFRIFQSAWMRRWDHWGKRRDPARMCRAGDPFVPARRGWFRGSRERPRDGHG